MAAQEDCEEGYGSNGEEYECFCEEHRKRRRVEDPDCEERPIHTRRPYKFMETTDPSTWRQRAKRLNQSYMADSRVVAKKFQSKNSVLADQDSPEQQFCGNERLGKHVECLVKIRNVREQWRKLQEEETRLRQMQDQLIQEYDQLMKLWHS